MRQIPAALSLLLILLQCTIGYRFTSLYIRRAVSLCSVADAGTAPSHTATLQLPDAQLLNFSPMQNAAMNNEPLVISYLGNELGVSDEALKRIILKHPWVLYLKVTSNIMPTIAVLESFGFGQRDIHQLISQAPSILGINSNWTLPEKLLSLRGMYHLTSMDLPRLVTAQPYLLTSSVDRNQRTATFLVETMGLGAEELSRLVMKEPRLAMSSADTLARCWGVLIKLYGFSAAEARKMVLRYPALLSLQLVRGVKERLVLFSSELGVPSFPSPYVQDLAKRFPPVLYIDTDLFLRPNIQTLHALLSGELLSNETYSQKASSNRTVNAGALPLGSDNDTVAPQLAAMLRVFPQLLGYNADTLRRLCSDALQLLTGRRGDGAGPACIASTWEPTVARMLADHSISQLDLLADYTGPYDMRDGVNRSGNRSGTTNLRLAPQQNPHTTPASGTHCSPPTLSSLALSAASLALTADRAVQTLRRAPWILAYRPQRSQMVLAALAVSLGLTREELSHCVSVYPRLLSLSVDGKLRQVLTALALYAVSFLAKHGPDTSDRCVARITNRNAITSGVDGRDQSLDMVRALVKEVVLRYPLVLGSGLERIAERFGAAASVDADWGAYLTALRRPDAQHDKWLAGCRLRRGHEATASLWPHAQTTKVKSLVPPSTGTTIVERKTATTNITERRGVVKGGKAKAKASAKQSVASGLATRNATDSSPGMWAGFKLGQVLILAHRRRRHRSSTPIVGDIGSVDVVTFSAYPQAQQVRPIFEEGDGDGSQRRVSAAARRLLNSLLPYRWLASS